MKITYSPKTLMAKFDKYGKIQFQKGSRKNHEENGVRDIDVINALMTYLDDMNSRHKSIYNRLAISNLQSASIFLQIRRGLSRHKANDKK